MKKQGAGEFGIPLDASLRSYDSREVSDFTATKNDGLSIVQQQFADEVNVNTIVRRFGLTRDMPSGKLGGVYGDFSGISGYEDAVAAIERARAGFMTLPADVREKFRNDPGRLISTVQDMTQEEFNAAYFPPKPAAPAAPPVVAPAVPPA